MYEKTAPDAHGVTMHETGTTGNGTEDSHHRGGADSTGAHPKKMVGPQKSGADQHWG